MGGKQLFPMCPPRVLKRFQLYTIIWLLTALNLSFSEEIMVKFGLISFCEQTNETLNDLKYKHIFSLSEGGGTKLGPQTQILHFSNHF